MAGIHDEDGLRFSAVGRIDEHADLPAVLHDALDGGGIRTDDSQQPLRGNIVSVSDVDEFQVAAPYSMFWICSRIFSISDLRSTTTFAMSAFWHLEPMVFASRLNS